MLVYRYPSIGLVIPGALIGKTILFTINTRSIKGFYPLYVLDFLVLRFMQ